MFAKGVKNAKLHSKTVTLQHERQTGESNVVNLSEKFKKRRDESKKRKSKEIVIDESRSRSLSETIKKFGKLIQLQEAEKAKVGHQFVEDRDTSNRDNSVHEHSNSPDSNRLNGKPQGPELNRLRNLLDQRKATLGQAQSDPYSLSTLSPRRPLGQTKPGVYKPNLCSTTQVSKQGAASEAAIRRQANPFKAIDSPPNPSSNIHTRVAAAKIENTPKAPSKIGSLFSKKQSPSFQNSSSKADGQTTASPWADRGRNSLTSRLLGEGSPRTLRKYGKTVGNQDLLGPQSARSHLQKGTRELLDDELRVEDAYASRIVQNSEAIDSRRSSHHKDAYSSNESRAAHLRHSASKTDTIASQSVREDPFDPFSNRKIESPKKLSTEGSTKWLQNSSLRKIKTSHFHSSSMKSLVGVSHQQARASVTSRPDLLAYNLSPVKELVRSSLPGTRESSHDFHQNHNLNGFGGSAKAFDTLEKLRLEITKVHGVFETTVKQLKSLSSGHKAGHMISDRKEKEFESKVKKLLKHLSHVVADQQKYYQENV